MRRWLWTLLLLAVLAPAETAVGVPAEDKATEVRVTVAERDGVPRKDWPVTFGMPMPRGLVRGLERLAILDGKGVDLPIQARILGQWDDGSIRWALLDTQVSMAANASVTLLVRLDGASPVRKAASPSGRVTVVETPEFDTVTTGPLRFRVAKRHFGPVESIEAEEASVPGPMSSFLDLGGGHLPAGPPRQVRLVEGGPLRARLEMEGEYTRGVRYLLRVEAYAGQPFVRIWHTLVDESPQPYLTFRQLALELPLPKGTGRRFRLAVEGGEGPNGKVPASGVAAYQVDNESYQVDGNTARGRLAGRVEWTGGNTTVGWASRWLWQEYPKSFVLQPTRLTYNLWPAEAAPARMGMGAAKTHEGVLWVTPTKQASEPDRLAATGLLAAVDPNWIARTGALPQAVAPSGQGGEFLRKAREAFTRYVRRTATEPWDDRGTVDCVGEEGARPRQGAYGMWNWGDWNFPGYRDRTKGCDAWGNLEYDTAQVLALLYAATGDPAVWDEMEAAARHFQDVDIIHFQDRHPEWVGMNHPKNPLHFSFELGGIDLGHTWTEGLVSYYWLSGEERALAAARGIADYLVRRAGNVGRVNPRQAGWPQIALLAVYQATGDARYRAAALEYARQGIRAHRPEGVANWKLGILADALAYTHAATGDAEIEGWLREFARSAVSYDKRGARLYPGVAYAATLSGDQSWRRAVLSGVESLDLGNWAKPFTIGCRTGFRVYALLGAGSAGAQASRETDPPAR